MADSQESPWSRLLLAATVVCALAAGSLAWNHTLLDVSGHRQTQTALTAYWFVHSGVTFDYETPAYGPPWRMPLEFPLYQHVVAVLARWTALPIDQAGRFVSLLFHFACLFPLWRILSRLGVTREGRHVVLSLFLASPLLLFWSRCVLIESTSVFLGLAFLDFGMAGLDRPGIANALATLVFGCLAGAVKVTTFVAFPVALVLWSGARWKRGQPMRPIFLGIAIVLPLLATMGWTWHADQVKLRSPLGQYMTSAALVEWTFGTLEQRLSRPAWERLVAFSTLAIGHRFLLLACLVSVLFSAGRRWQILSCLLLAAVSPLLFMNLYVVHEYYACENALGLIVALGLVVVGLLESGGAARYFGIALLAIALLVNAMAFAIKIHPRFAANRLDLQPTVEAIQAHTRPDDVILVVGTWNPELPYYAQRRALVLPTFPHISDEAIRQSLENLSGYRVGAVVTVPSAMNARDEQVERWIHEAFPELRVPIHRDDTFQVQGREESKKPD